MSTFKIAAVQSTPIFMEREATVDKTCELIAEVAQDDDVRLVVFPEAGTRSESLSKGSKFDFSWISYENNLNYEKLYIIVKRKI